MKVIQRPRATLHWAVMSAPIGFWMVHLVYMAAVATQQSDPSWRWTLYAITPICAIPTAICMALSYHWYRKYAGSEVASDEAQLEFLGLLGVAHGAFSLLLIIAEGVLVPILTRHG